MKTLTIMLGDYGSGKTTYAKAYARKVGALYLDVDLITKQDGQYSHAAFVDRIRVLMATSKHDAFVLDGSPDSFCQPETLKERLGCVIRYRVAFASPKTIIEHQSRKQHTGETLLRSVEDVINMTHYCAVLATSRDPGAVFVETDTGNPEWRLYSYPEWLPYWQELSFAARLGREYQDIELPHLRIPGYSSSAETWNRLKSCAYFKGKSVIDYGCNLGYFLFKSEDAGASDLRGVDVHAPAIATARKIATLRSSMATFECADLETWQPAKRYDVALCLNVLHHIKDHPAFLDRVFRNAHTVIVEMPRDQMPEVDVAAKSVGLVSSAVLNSHRLDRCLVRYGRLVEVVRLETHRRYAYTESYYRKQRVAHWWQLRQDAFWRGVGWAVQKVKRV